MRIPLCLPTRLRLAAFAEKRSSYAVEEEGGEAGNRDFVEVSDRLSGVEDLGEAV